MIKTILVPTDYSAAANNALKYALNLAGYTSAKLVLLHVYHIPVPTAETPIMFITPQELEKENRSRIKKLENSITKSLKKVKAESFVRPGLATDEILDITKEKKIDLIVMGIHGAGKNPLWGSTTTAIMKKTKCPVLVIPDKTKFKKPKKMVFAYDFNGKIPENVINSVKPIAMTFNAEVIMFDMLLPREKKYQKALTKIHVDKIFGKTKHSMHFREGENVKLEISQFAKEKKADWLIMVPRKYNLWDSLFHRSNTKQMAFETKIPLLAGCD